MSIARDPSIRDLNDCGCCAGGGAGTPARIHNRPGLTALAYRVGTHGTFKQSMLAALSSSERPSLSRLNTRDDDDFSIALIDAWATVGDILTFYQERTANELFLGTAVARRSMIDLVALIGYRLRPGVAASTELAFRLEDAPGAPRRVLIEAGTKVQSLPGPGERPQTFETVEAVDARVEWNALAPQSRTVVAPGEGSTEVYLAGVTTGLQPGDGLLLHRSQFRLVESVTPDAEAGYTHVTWDEPLGVVDTPEEPGPVVHALRQRAALFGNNAPDWRAMPDSVKRGFLGLGSNDDIPAAATNWPAFNIFYSTDANPSGDTIYLDATYPKILKDSWIVLTTPSNVQAFQVIEVAESGLSEFTISGKSTRLQLDSSDLLAPFATALRETVVFAQSEPLQLAEQPLFPDLAGDEEQFQFTTGTLMPVEGVTLTFVPPIPDFESGRDLVVSGKRLRARIEDPAATLTLVAADGMEKVVTAEDDLFVLSRSVNDAGALSLTLVDGIGFEGAASLGDVEVLLDAARDSDPQVGERATVLESVSTDETTIVTLASPLRSVYDRPTVVVHGNVAGSTHGESVSEVLGSGDAGKAYQRFTLKQAPLTYVPSDDPSGGESTLRLRVNEVLWHETESLFGHGPRDRVYVTDLNDDGETTVQFGDGKSGARLPSGQENVSAVYRKGIGSEGGVDAGQLSLLMTRPLGVQGVTNPLPATGAQDPQQLDDARQNAPLTVLTLDRIVSLQDYEDFARSFSGIAKAQATWVWTQNRRGVLITVAGVGGAAVSEDSTLYDNLISSISKFGNPRVPFIVRTYRQATFHVLGTITVHPDYIAGAVLADVKAVLTSQFSFEARAFGQLVALSEIIGAVHDVEGVVAVDIDLLYRDDESPAANAVLVSALPQSGTDAGSVQAAEILTLNPASLDQIEVRQ